MVWEKIKGKLAGIFGGTSIGLGALGAFGVCHTVCTAAISALAVFGIVVGGMPLFGPMQFLEKYNYIFLTLGAISLAISIYWFIQMRKGKCVLPLHHKAHTKEVRLEEENGKK